MPMVPGHGLGAGGDAAAGDGAAPPRVFVDSRGEAPRAAVAAAVVPLPLASGGNKENAPAAAPTVDTGPRRRPPPTADDDLPKRTRRSARAAAGSGSVEADEKVPSPEAAGARVHSAAAAAAAAAPAAPALAAEANSFAAFASARLWVDVRDGNGIWWPAELIGGPCDDEVQVRLQRGLAPPRAAADDADGADDAELWVDPKVAVAMAGAHAYYGIQDSVAKPRQAVLFNRVARRSAVPSAGDGDGGDDWVPAVITSVDGAGIVTVQLLDRADSAADAAAGGMHRVHHQSHRLRPLGPPRLSRFNKVPVAVTLCRLQTLMKNTRRGAGAVPLHAQPPPPEPDHPDSGAAAERAPLQSVSNVDNQRQNESKNSANFHQAQRRAGAYNGARASRRLVAAGSAPHAHFRDSLDAAGMRLFPCVGDGNCLYRSVAHQVYGDQDMHGLVRNVAFMHMRAHEEDFSPFCAALMEEHVAEDLLAAGDRRRPEDLFSDADLFRMYLDMYSRDGVWGGDPEISAMCRVYGRTAHLFVYDRHHGHRVDVRDVVPGAPPMLLSYYGGGHYDSITDRGFAARLLRRPPGELENDCARQYAGALRRFGNYVAAGGFDNNGGGGNNNANNGSGGGGGAKSDDMDKRAVGGGSTRNKTLGKKDRVHMKQALAKLFGTDSLDALDDEKLLKDMEDQNVQAVLNVTGNADPDDVDKAGRIDADVVSKDFVEMQQAILRQVVHDNMAQAQAGFGGAAAPAAAAALGGGRAGNNVNNNNNNNHNVGGEPGGAAAAPNGDDNSAAAAAASAAGGAGAEGAVVAGDGGAGAVPGAQMTEEEQLAYVLALSASENPILAAVDVDDDAAAAADGGPDAAASAGVPAVLDDDARRDDHSAAAAAAAAAHAAAEVDALAVAAAAGLHSDRDKNPDDQAAALVAAQAEALRAATAAGGRRTTRSQTGALHQQHHQNQPGLSEEELTMIAMAMSEGQN